MSAESHHEYLYHYTTLETALENILPSGKIKFSSFAKTNDPRESKEWYFGYLYAPENFSQIVNGINKKISDEIKRGCRIFCSSLDDSNMPGDNGRGFSRPRMWAQYASNHRGVCLMFDKSRLIELALLQLRDKGNIFYDQVEYITKDEEDEDWYTIDYSLYKSLGTDYLKKCRIEQFYKKYYFRKHSDWQEEKEYRILLAGIEDTDEFIDFKEALQGIILGVDFPQIYVSIVHKYCRMDRNILLARVDWYNGFPRLVEDCKL